MAFYMDEDEVWKCPKHPSKRRRTGICHVCLRERLASLCPNCAHARPCACIATTSSSSSSSSSFSRFSVSGGEFPGGIGSVGRVSNLLDNEPAFRRSRSLAIPFLHPKSKFTGETGDYGESPAVSRARMKTVSFWSFLKGNKNKMNDGKDGNNKNNEGVEEERRRMMRKSRSVAVTSGIGGGDVKVSKGKGWYFPSPIKAFRQSRISKVVVQQRSPLYRG